MKDSLLLLPLALPASCLEGCLAAQGCSGVELLRQDLEETSTRLHRAQSCEAELRAELACVTER